MSAPDAPESAPSIGMTGLRELAVVSGAAVVGAAIAVASAIAYTRFTRELNKPAPINVRSRNDSHDDDGSPANSPLQSPVSTPVKEATRRFSLERSMSR